MSRSLDLTNKKFGKLTAIKPAEPHISPSGRKRSQWFCVCDCTKTLTVLTESLTSGHTRSCGCIRKDNGWRKTEKIIGEKYGKLTILKRVEDTRDVSRKVVRYECLCDCGNTVIVDSEHLKNGSTKSCGCLRHDNLIGQRFGKLVVIDRILDTTRPNLKRYTNKCQCDCGGITFTYTENLTKGAVQSCGCLMSKGEEKINQWLVKNHVDFISHYHVKDMLYSTKTYPYFDFAIFKNNQLQFLIEYQGTIHYFYNESGWNNKINFDKRQALDEEKRNLCKEFNIDLIEISYWDYDNIEIILTDLIKHYKIDTARMIDEHE